MGAWRAWLYVCDLGFISCQSEEWYLGCEKEHIGRNMFETDTALEQDTLIYSQGDQMKQDILHLPLRPFLS